MATTNVSVSREASKLNNSLWDPLMGQFWLQAVRLGEGDQFKHLQRSPQVAVRPKMELLLMPRLDFRDNTDLKEKRDDTEPVSESSYIFLFANTNLYQHVDLTINRLHCKVWYK